jgi:transcriptional regulator with XRE-family HTH domain
MKKKRTKKGPKKRPKKTTHEALNDAASTAANIKHYRTAQKLSARELSRRAGVSSSYVSQVENGQNSSMVVLSKIAVALGITLVQLIAGPEPEP